MSTNDLDQIARLFRLRESGALTQAEFDTEKTRVFSAEDGGHGAAKEACPTEPVGVAAYSEARHQYDEPHQVEPYRRSKWPLALAVLAAILVIGTATGWYAAKSGNEVILENPHGAVTLATGADPSETLATITARLKKAAIASKNNIDKSRDGYRFAATVSTKRGDFDGDSDADAVILVSTCEKTNCHLTTSSSVITLLRNDQGRYVEALQFDALINPVVQKMVEGSVVVRSATFGPNDSHCCPEEIHTQTVTISPSGGMKVREVTKESLVEPINFGNLDSSETLEDDGRSSILQSLTVPSDFLGTWDESLVACKLGPGLSPSRLQILSQKISFYEASGNVQSVQELPDGVDLVAGFVGEGEKWTDSIKLQLKDDELSVTTREMRPAKSEYVRC